MPDHSSFSKNRHGRFRESDAFRLVFEAVVARCVAEGLVGGEGFAVDASVVKADASRARRVSGEEFGFLQHEHATRAVHEYLAGLDGESEPATRHSVSLTDPGAVWTAAPGGPAFFGYSTNYLIDVQAGIVLDVEATGAVRTQEVDATRKMIERVEQRFEMTDRKVYPRPLAICHNAACVARLQPRAWPIVAETAAHRPEAGYRRPHCAARTRRKFLL